MAAPRSPFSAQVSDLLASPGSRRRLRLRGEMEMNLPQVERCGLVTAELELEATAGGVVARGRARTEAAVLCNRCLGETPRTVRAELTGLFAAPGAAPDQPVGFYPVQSDGRVDFGPLLRDEISTAFPLVTLCRRDCRGLCATCGADLNVGECGGHAEEAASPFAELKNLLDAMGRDDR